MDFTVFDDVEGYKPMNKIERATLAWWKMHKDEVIKCHSLGWLILKAFEVGKRYGEREQTRDYLDNIFPDDERLGKLEGNK